MNEPLPREPNPENIPIANQPHSPLTLTMRGYLLVGAGLAIVLMMAYGSCHRSQETYGPRYNGQSRENGKKQESQGEKAKREYEQWLEEKKKSQTSRLQSTAAAEGQPASPAPQKTAKQLQAEDLEKRLHEAAYAVPLVTDAPTKRTDEKTQSAQPNSGEATASDRNQQPTAGKFITLPIGTILNAETVNMLDGSNVGPLMAMLTRPVYAENSQRIVIPQGAKLFGEAARISSLDQERLAVMFHNLAITPDHIVSLDKVSGLDQEGATGLHDQVNRHYAQIFGVSMALGALGGLAQIGNGSYGGLTGYDASTQIRNGMTNSLATSSGMVLNRFLQRPPTVRIRPGVRVDVLLMDPLKIPDVLE